MSNERAATCPTAAIMMVFTNTSGILSKRISLGTDGNLTSDSACAMREGTATRTPVADASALAELLNSMRSNQALALGRTNGVMPGKVEITTIWKPKKGAIPRTLQNFTYHPEPGYGLIDFDCKFLPSDVAATVDARGGLRAAILHLAPGLADAAMVERASTSSGISDTSTGKMFPGSGGRHLYVNAADMTDWPRALRTLHDRCFLGGMGFYRVSKSGALLERSLVDVAVASPERLVFEGSPVVEAPLAQDVAARAAVATPGIAVDTRRVLLDLTAREREQLDSIKRELRAGMEQEAARARAKFVDQTANEIARRTMLPLTTAREVAEKQAGGTLMPDTLLVFDDPSIGAICVREVLLDPQRFVGATLADPNEGPSYGRCKAMLMIRAASGEPWINSFAHGGITYELRHTGATVRDAVAVAPDDAGKAHAFCEAVARSLLGEVEVDTLRDELIIRPKVAKARSINADIKAARSVHAAARPRKRREEASDLRVMFHAPKRDEELVPVLTRLDQVLAKVDALIPPMRNTEGKLVELIERKNRSLHRLTEEGGDNEAPANKRLDAPAYLTLATRDTQQVQMLVSRHVRYEKTIRTRDASTTYNTDLPDRFASAYNDFEGSTLPVVGHVITAPLLLPDGTMLMGDGLDRSSGLLFRVDPKLSDAVPDPAKLTQKEVAEALCYLVEVWLADCLTDFAGKIIIIAHALTVMFRALLPKRPMFFYEAGQRASGKTTALEMAVMAAVGREPPAAAWSVSEEERRKAMHSYLMEGIPCLAFDNLPRGAKIGCAVLAKYCTSSSSADRVLGVSRTAVVPNATVIAVTGNNIVPAGDNASRSLVVHFTSDRPDPENRPVGRPDPVKWTSDHRLGVLRALYMVAMASRLSAPRAAVEGRFKVWSELIATPIEAAIEMVMLADASSDVRAPEGISAVSFRELLTGNEQDDPETDAAGEVLDILARNYGTGMGLGKGGNFTARQLADAMNGVSADANPTIPRDDAHAVERGLRAATEGQMLRRSAGGDLKLCPRLVATALLNVKGRVVRTEGRSLVLRGGKPAHAGTKTPVTWWVEVRL